MKVISWNIHISSFPDKEEYSIYLDQKERVKEIIKNICDQQADVIVLQETNNRFATELQTALGENYQVCIHTEFTYSNSKVLIAYKIADGDVKIKLYDKTNGSDFAYARWIELSYKGFEIVGLHASLPINKIDTKRLKQRAFWTRILKYAEENKDKQALLVGDFNVYEKTAFSNSPSKAIADFKTLQKGKWKVLKTKRTDDFSFCYKCQWDRQLDYALVSPTFKGDPKIEMLRFEQLSDHEMLVVQLFA